MHKNIKGTSLNYVDYGNAEGTTLLLLHGWGQCIDMMKPLGDPFQKDYRIVIVDLPGFGDSSEPEVAWNVTDYVECIREFIEELVISNLIIIGHSFGGKIGLLYASKYDIEKLIVLGSPFKKEIKELSLKTKMLKKLKEVPGLNKFEGIAKKHVGSSDYRNASALMRKILVNTINLDITDDVKKIKCSTIIIWGDLDAEVSVERAYELEKLIDDAGVVVFPGCTHYAYLERLNQTINVIRVFIES